MNNPEETLIGLTGTYCAGKNYIAGLLEKRGLPVLDVDKLGHEVMEAEKEAILGRFGPSVLASDGTIIDRRSLGQRVFGKPEELAALEAIVHPAANRLTEAWIQGHPGVPCVINAALLHRSSVFPGLRAIILVRAPAILRFLRARKRDRLPLWDLVKRFKSQRQFNTQYLQGKTDIYTVDNTGFSVFSWGGLENRIDTILSRLGIMER
ncbi:dephospho-CoA kinase [Spirochaetia bacterium]|nr:dephospho-CoA kinase [Spirochaetia bacterium]